jgi:hypothetical protein
MGHERRFGLTAVRLTVPLAADTQAAIADMPAGRSAIGGKAAVPGTGPIRRLANNGLKLYLDSNRNVAHRDSDGGCHSSHQKHAIVCHIYRTISRLQTVPGLRR